MDKITNKIRKLLALVNSSNVNEASAAMAAAQRLMTEHSINEAMLAQDDPSSVVDEPVEDQVFSIVGGRRVTWKSKLAFGMANANGCGMYNSFSGGQRTINLVGPPSRVATLRYMFNYICSEIERLAREKGAELGKPGKTWYNSFKTGAAREVVYRVEAQVREERERARELAESTDRVQGTGGAALVRVSGALARMDAQQDKAWQVMRGLGLKRGVASKARFDAHGYGAGRAAGRSINLSHGGQGKVLGS